MYIDETNKRKYSPDKVVLLGLLVLVVLIAQLIVKSKSKISLGSPITLEAAGLSVSLPKGNGWECDNAWRVRNFNRKEYSISAFYQTTRKRNFFHPQAQVELRYVLNRYKTESHSRIQKRADLIDKGIIIKDGVINIGQVRIEWSHIFDPGQNSNVFFGTAMMPDDYLLDIDVIETENDIDFAKRIFESIVKSIQFDKLN